MAFDSVFAEEQDADRADMIGKYDDDMEMFEVEVERDGDCPECGGPVVNGLCLDCGADPDDYDAADDDYYDADDYYYDDNYADAA